MQILSLGAGVQSSTLALMASLGEVTPMPTAAVFADTQGEPASVYRWLDWLGTQLAFPIVRVTRGSLEREALRVRTSANGKHYTKHAPPAFIIGKDGKRGLLMRQCTEDFKITIIKRAIRSLMREHNARSVTQWIGISSDEAGRMKQARVAYLKNRWPLIELGLSRADCLAWMKAKHYPEPPRSACVFCPYHDDNEWLRLKNSEPIEFERAVVWEKSLQQAYARVAGFHGTPFLHRSCQPLSEVKFKPTPPSPSQMQFSGTCLGMCGL